MTPGYGGVVGRSAIDGVPTAPSPVLRSCEAHLNCVSSERVERVYRACIHKPLSFSPLPCQLYLLLLSPVRPGPPPTPHS